MSGTQADRQIIEAAQDPSEMTAFPSCLGRFAPLMNALMPMFLWIDDAGRIQGLGRTLHKALDEAEVLGQPFDRFFAIGRQGHGGSLCPNARDAEGYAPRSLQPRESSGLLRAMARERAIHLTLRARPGLSLRGEAFAMPEAEGGGVVMKLSFGIYLREAVAAFNLTERDFSAADLAMEMLYLQEAKSLVMAELRALTTRLETARKEAETQALTDPLTKLPNRRAMEQALTKAIAGAAAGGAPFAVVQIDLDHFKTVNDTHGHAAGDYVLQSVARILRDALRAGDIAARMGGDEFLLMLRGRLGRDEVRALAARLIAQLEAPKWYGRSECLISGSLGAAFSQDYLPEELGQVLGDVDHATYASKEAGRGCLRFARPPSM
ncbi:GGDEF domain-containing protein [Thioclava atlantica]|uniref:Diguanylate cyclase/phosphodiesterase n=1 Tax=Thioclava atlantica TaxID=1317124 RepID=A0A085U117_9RHOB|nr:GGDEF domain-containing protein [Thioclava atlantica]KFE36664.1 diguanylate cyclase/phosphodiesterase [Thioclava atlantica]